MRGFRGFSKVLVGAAVVAVVGASTLAHAADDVRLRLNWMYYGSHAGFAYGKDKGYYKDAGINLDIRSGNGSGSAHRLVANGDKSVKDLKGKKILTTANAGVNTFFPIVVKTAGLADSDITLVNVAEGAL